VTAAHAPVLLPLAQIDKIILITRRTRLEQLVDRFNTKGQARFYIEHGEGDFADYQLEHDIYRKSLDQVRRSLDLGLELQVVDRSFIPNFNFSDRDIIVTLGQDGLVANVAKYSRGRPIVAVNPDPSRFDGVLMPFGVDQAAAAAKRCLEGHVPVRPVTLAHVQLSDSQELVAFNDFFIGRRTHISARYRIHLDREEESQISSGIIVSTGAGSSGWLSSVFNMADGLARFSGAAHMRRPDLEWEAPRLAFVVREPFASRQSQANLVAGVVTTDHPLHVESFMPSGGVIFSDGIEEDYLDFNSGVSAIISCAQTRAHLVQDL